jgi:hypothetical protein
MGDTGKHKRLRKDPLPPIEAQLMHPDNQYRLPMTKLYLIQAPSLKQSLSPQGYQLGIHRRKLADLDWGNPFGVPVSLFHDSVPTG